MLQIGNKNFIVSKKSRLIQALITSVVTLLFLLLFQFVLSDRINYVNLLLTAGLQTIIVYFVFPLFDGRKQYTIEEDLPEPMLYELVRGYGVAQLLKKGGGMGTFYITNEYFYFHPDRTRMEQTTVLCHRTDITEKTLTRTFLGDALLTLKTKKGQTHRFLLQNLEEWEIIL